MMTLSFVDFVVCNHQHHLTCMQAKALIEVTLQLYVWMSFRNCRCLLAFPTRSHKNPILHSFKPFKDEVVFICCTVIGVARTMSTSFMWWIRIFFANYSALASTTEVLFAHMNLTLFHKGIFHHAARPVRCLTSVISSVSRLVPCCYSKYHFRGSQLVYSL